MIFKEVCGEIQKDSLIMNVITWKLLKETSKYYEVKASDGKVKRLDKQNIGIARSNQKGYVNASLRAYCFCFEDDVEAAKENVIEFLNNQLETLEIQIALNRLALSRKHKVKFESLMN